MRFNIADRRIQYTGQYQPRILEKDFVVGFNHRHRMIFRNYDIHLEGGEILPLTERINNQSNLGALRNRQLRESVILAAGLSAIAVALHGRASLNNTPKELITRELTNELKRANDRTAAQVMAEVLQYTTETFPVGEEILIESAITEGVRAKPGKEPGGNPTIAVGALFGKKEHRTRYGLPMPKNVTLLSMGSDVIDGTTKSVKGLHSSLTALFLTESGVKRHLPDVYVQRWMAGVNFEEFNPREASLTDAAEIIINAYGLSSPDRLSAFFLDRKRHHPAMDILNKAGISTPMDNDADLFPSLVLGLDNLHYPDGRRLLSMIGEIGGSAEWAVGVLPLVWRGGQAIGMLTSQSALTREDISGEELWKSRFHFTEEEFILIQDARFEQKPYFTIGDILEQPFAGGVAAYGSLTDNYYLPFMEGVQIDKNNARMTVNVLVINSMGVMENWRLTFAANSNLKNTAQHMQCPKDFCVDLSGNDLERKIGEYLADEQSAKRYRIFFNNEYYPAMIPIRDKLVMLNGVIDSLIQRGALNQKDREIIDITRKLAADWFVGYD
ncbi:MAG: fructose-bisphosphatase class II [candidate division Zixibacteria bacterium]|nr:fructose-bisphosphatase class II [candidate division Zixibacteria bacterium]